MIIIFIKKSNKIVNKYYRNASYSIQGGSINCYVHYSILNVVVFPIFLLLSYFILLHETLGWAIGREKKIRIRYELSTKRRIKKDQISKDCIKRCISYKNVLI
ncbi:hypothetical protein ACKWTF_008518 [Chironomus riparius]